MLLLPVHHTSQSPMQPSATIPTPRPQVRGSSSTPKTPRTDSERWLVLTTRDPAHTNTFIYAVTTTKIYCRPNCPSRLARRANVEFFTHAREAVAAGYRACKRCKPEQGESLEEEDGSEKVRRAVALTREKAKKGEKISLAELSREVGLSKWHLQRAFKRRVGVSPREMGERVEREGGTEEKGTLKEEQGEFDESFIGLGEAETLWAFTPESSAGWTESTSGSSSYEISNLPTPLSLDIISEDGGMDWLTGCDADQVMASQRSPFGLRQESNFADTADWDPEVESMIRDLFPEIYE